MKVTKSLLEGFLNKFVCVTTPHHTWNRPYYHYGTVVEIYDDGQVIVLQDNNGGLHEIKVEKIFEIYLAPNCVKQRADKLRRFDY